MSDEEKKAIETLTNKRPSEQMLISGKMCVNVLINLIEKQSKEIEESKQKEKEAYNFGYRNGCNDTSKFNDKTFIRIDKIKAKIEFVKSLKEKLYYEENVIEILESLLEKE